MSELEKEMAINQYLCDTAEYDTAALENAGENDFEDVDDEFNDSFTPYGVLLNKTGVCSSYAGAFKLLAEEAGLECIVVTGYLDGELPHAWNKVKIDGEWQIVDSTNNDSELIFNALLNLPDTAADKVLVEDERYVLRQSKPIPAVLNRPIYMSSDTDGSQDVTATVERNVFGGDGRTIIIPSGSQLIGVAKLPDAVGIQAVQKINISWNRLIRPDGAEFDLGAVGNYSADAQGRAGVPGKNDTEYMQQLFIKPLLYSALPVAMEAIFPSTSNLVTRVRRSDGTYNTIAGVANTFDITVDGNNDNYSYDWNDTTYQLDMSSKDKIKAEIQQNFKSVMQKLIEDSAKQKIPFTVPSGTRIQVFLNNDIMLRTTDGIDELINGENMANKYTYGGESEATDIRRTNVNYTFSSDSTDGATTFKDYTTDAGGTAINQGYGADDAYYDDTGDVYDEDTGEVYY